MYGMRRLASMTIGLATLLGSSTACAVFEPNGLYGIGGIGWGWIENAELQRTIVNGEQLTVNLKSKSEFMFRFGLGTLLSDLFGVEFRYNQFNTTSTHEILPDTVDSIRLRTTPYYFDLNALVRAAFSPTLSGFLTLGPGYGKVQRNYTLTNLDYVIVKNSKDKDTTGFGVAGSVGLQYEFSPLWGLRLEAAGIKGTSKNDIKLGSVSGNVVINIL